MLATAIIVFRETLEAALIVGIVLAASRGVAGNRRWVGIGVLGGVLGAGLAAAFAGEISDFAAGAGQELFNAVILLFAVTMLGWHNVWMSRHGREIAREMSALGHAVREGSRPLYALAIVVGIAVLREGAETVLFLWGIAAASPGQGVSMFAGGVVGVALGVGCGWALYRGLLAIPVKHLFTATSWMVLMLAAGLASQAAGQLVAGDLLPPLVPQMWDSSWLLSTSSIPGRMLHTLIGYDDRPSAIQLVFYVATLAVIGGLMLTIGRLPARPRPASPAAAE
jgi:high-affinity iron transporter